MGQTFRDQQFITYRCSAVKCGKRVVEPMGLMPVCDHGGLACDTYPRKLMMPVEPREWRWWAMWMQDHVKDLEREIEDLERDIEDLEDELDERDDDGEGQVDQGA